MSKPKSDRTRFFQLRLSTRELREFHAVAKAEDVDLSKLCRRLLRDHAEKVAKREARS